MKFLSDIGISPKSTLHLRKQGYDAVHLSEEDLYRMPDPEILAKALVEDRILLTHDLDFGELMAASGNRLPSVIIFRLADMSTSSVNHYLDLILESYAEPLLRGAIISVTDRRIRVRTLPIRSSSL